MSVELRAEGLAAGYGKKHVVDRMDLVVEPGRILLMLGHNGAGKTTLARALFGLLAPTAGRVRYGGADITARTPAKNVSAGIAFVPQGHGIFRTLTVGDNLELGAFSEADTSRLDERRGLVYEMFPILHERAAQTGGTLSGGQQQMLAIGMALMHAPKLMILDEPSLGLAPLIVSALFETIRTVAASGVTMLLVEQNVAMALDVATRAYVLEEGRIAAEGRPEELRRRPEIRRAYLGLTEEIR